MRKKIKTCLILSTDISL